MRLPRFVVAAALAAMALTLSGCTSSEPAPIATVTDSLTPIATPSPTPTAPPGTWYTVDQAFSLSPATDPQGSGCAPGPGPLPDGVWFGFANTWSSSEIGFDLVCWYTGDMYDNGYDVVNSNPAVRVEPVAPDVVALKGSGQAFTTDPSTWKTYTLAQVIADPWGESDGGNLGGDAPYRVCIAVNGGVVTELAVQWTP